MIDPCMGLPALMLSVSPNAVRVGTAVTLTASGGSGHYEYAVGPGGSGGMVNGDRFVAGMTPAMDTLSVIDDCHNTADAKLDVRAAFSVVPSKATVKPGTSFTVQVAGLIGTAVFMGDSLPSGGTIGMDGHYTAGASEGLDLIEVQDSVTGDQAVLQFTVSKTAAMHAAPARLALPAGASVPLNVDDGSNVVNWTVMSGPGLVADGGFTVPPGLSGTAVLKGQDMFTNETTTVTVRVLDELVRTGRPHGRLTDVASIVTGDFDGDGIQDVAVGVPESDLARPLGGAVFIYKGSSAGLSGTATWTILGGTDTSQLGAVMAAGDLDGDGKDDLAISAPGADIIATDSGAVLLYRFADDGPHLIRDPLSGLAKGANFGASIAIADVDGDGDKDLIIGSPGADLAATATVNSRGVVDVFILQKGQPIANQGTLRVGGWDTAPDGTFKVTTALRFGRWLAVGDLNGDGHADLSFLGAISPPASDGGSQKSQLAVAVSFGRASGQLFNDQPDLFVLPANLSDTDEGNGRLGIVPPDQGRPPMLLVTLERADSPNLTMGDAGTAGGTNGGGAYLFDLSTQMPSGAAPTTPLLIQRAAAFARIYGDAASIQAGRAFALADVDGQPGLELILGAPYASNGATPLTGKLLVYPLSALTQGAVVNRASDFRAGARAEALGTAVAAWKPATATSLVALAPRATTTFGDFTGRVEAASGTGPLQMWTAANAEVPAKLAAEQFGLSVRLGATAGKVRALVGAPGFSGPDPNAYGTDTQVGQAVAYDSAATMTSTVVHEGAVTLFRKDGGAEVFGGRAAAFDVALTDFDGDGRLDFAVAVPGFATPTLSSADYVTVPDAGGCSTGSTLGGVTVHLVQSDGSDKEAFRIWAPAAIAGCNADAGVTACTRSALSRTGIGGGFDFNHDGKQDLAVTRTNGLEIFLGRAPDDPQLNKLTAQCGSAFTLPALATATYGPVPLGDLDGDGCDEIAVRYGAVSGTTADPFVTPNGVVIVFGFDPGGMCGASTAPSWVRISGEPEVGINSMQLGFAIAPAGKVLGDARKLIAISARLYPYNGVAQPAVLLYDAAQIVAKRSMGIGVLAGAIGDGLTPVPVLYSARAPGLGRALAGNIDVNGDGTPDLIVGAPGANINGDGTGAVFVFAGGPSLHGQVESLLTIVGDGSERGNFGQDLSASPAVGALPSTLGIGAPASYRTGTSNGTAFTLPLGF
jgi:hypothetical protein